MAKTLTIEQRIKKLGIKEGKEFLIEVHNPNNLPLYDLEDIKDLQGELKEFLDQESEIAFIEVLKDKGLVLPFFIWVDSKGVKYMLDGSGRRKLVNKYLIRSKQFGSKFPCLIVPAKTKKKAAEIILQISSSWHNTTKVGMEDFLKKFKLDFNFINQSTTFDFFNNEEFDEKTLDKFFNKSNDKSKGDKFKIILEYSVEDKYNEVLESLKQIDRTPEGALEKLLNKNK